MSQDMKYEIMYATRPNTDEETETALVEHFDTILRDNGVKVIESKDQGRCRLAYKMNRFREGIYHTVNVTSPSIAGAIDEFDRLAKTNDDVIRHMIVKVEA